MDSSLYLMNLENFRGLLNDLIRDQNNPLHALKKTLKSTYKLSNQDAEAIAQMVQEKSPLSFQSSIDPKMAQKVQHYLAVLELRPRGYLPEAPDLEKIKALVQSKIFKTIKLIKEEQKTL